MASWRNVLVLVVVTGGTMTLMAWSKADEVSIPGSSPDRLAHLLLRVEQLERRVESLEGRPREIQQSTLARIGADQWVTPAPPAPQPSPPQFGVVYQLKRFVPESPLAPLPSPGVAGQNPLPFGGVEIRR